MSKKETRKTRSGTVSKALQKMLPFAVPVVTFSILINLLRLTVPLYMLQVIDRVMSSESVETLVSITLIAFAALLTSGLLSNTVAQVQMNFGAWLEDTLFARVARSSLEPQGAHGRGAAAAPARDLSQLRQFFSSPTIMSLLEVPWSFLFIGILYYLNIYLGIVATTAFIVLLVISVTGELLTQSTVADGQQAKEKTVKSLGSAVNSSEAVRAMGIQDRLVQKLNARNLAASKKMAKGSRGTILTQQLAKTLRFVAQISMLGAGALLVLDGQVTMGTMIAGSILLSLALSPVDKAVSSFKSIRNVRKSVSTLDELLDRTDKPKEQKEMAFDKGVSIALHQAMFMPPGVRKPVLRPLSLEFKAGKCIGIIGPVGSGKTTLCRMLVGVTAPSSGSVQANEIELSRLSGPAFGAHVGYLPQNEPPILGTVAENISRFDTSNEEERDRAVIEAARLAGLNQVIMNLPQQYQTMIGTGGVETLSRGQIQQVLIARTFYKNPSLIVMDEPATSLDKNCETVLADAIEKAKSRGATVFLVTQKQSLVAKCDTLIYLKDGSLVTVGSSEQVLREIAQGDVKPGPKRLASGGGDQQQRSPKKVRRP